MYYTYFWAQLASNMMKIFHAFCTKVQISSLSTLELQSQGNRTIYLTYFWCLEVVLSCPHQLLDSYMQTTGTPCVVLLVDCHCKIEERSSQQELLPTYNMIIHIAVTTRDTIHTAAMLKMKVRLRWLQDQMLWLCTMMPVFLNGMQSVPIYWNTHTVFPYKLTPFPWG